MPEQLGECSGAEASSDDRLPLLWSEVDHRQLHAAFCEGQPVPEEELTEDHVELGFTRPVTNTLPDVRPLAPDAMVAYRMTTTNAK